MEVIILAIITIVMAGVIGFLTLSLHGLSKVVKQYQEMTDRYVEIRRKELGIK